jgi:hypothetical protein
VFIHAGKLSELIFFRRMWGEIYSSCQFANMLSVCSKPSKAALLNISDNVYGTMDRCENTTCNSFERFISRQYNSQYQA